MIILNKQSVNSPESKYSPLHQHKKLDIKTLIAPDQNLVISSSSDSLESRSTSLGQDLTKRPVLLTQNIQLKTVH